MSDPRVDADWIAGHLDDPAVRIVEVDVSPAAYDEGHILGAVLWNAYGHMRRPDYTLVDDGELADLLERSGIAEDTTVVFYGYGAHLGYWLLRSRGHRDVRFLDGPRDQWSGDWSDEVPSHARASYILPAANELQASRDDLLEGDTLVVDVRSQPEYDGERFWPSGAPEEKGRPGRVPGAVHVPITALRTDDGAYRDLEEMRRVFADAGVTPDRRVITYCTIGNRAAQAWFALTELLGHSDAAVYYGSWAEWGMVLSGGLSNIDLEPLEVALATVHFPTVGSTSQKSKAGWPDGRRKFGEVSSAIKVVLAKNGGEMRIKIIHAEVEQLLGGEVSFQSVADYLLKNSKEPKPLFVRTRYGHYELLRRVG